MVGAKREREWKIDGKCGKRWKMQRVEKEIEMEDGQRERERLRVCVGVEITHIHSGS